MRLLAILWLIIEDFSRHSQPAKRGSKVWVVFASEKLADLLRRGAQARAHACASVHAHAPLSYQCGSPGRTSSLCSLWGTIRSRLQHWLVSPAIDDDNGVPLPLPDKTDFLKAAAEADLVALCVPLNFDHETAVTLADRFVDEEHFFLLESATAGPGSIARYSFFGFDPLWTFSWSLGEEHGQFRMKGGGEKNIPLTDGNPFSTLRSQIAPTRLAAVYPPDCRLGGPDVASMGGACGIFAYDTAQVVEPTVAAGEKAPEKTLDMPDVFFFLPGSFLVLDHLSKRLFVVRHVFVNGLEDKALEKAFAEEMRVVSGMLKRLTAVHSPPPLSTVDQPPRFEACRQSFPKEKFLPAVERCLQEIRAGEIFQVQIGNRLSHETDARPFDIFRHLRTLNPSPYMFFYKFGDHHILGASPEMMVNVQDGKVTHRPIAGTRKRTWNQAKDRLMRQELVESEKERAEHVMLVDLGRNDVGRVAAPGSVRVEELMTVEEYSHVFHLVSQVSGELAESLDAFDALKSGFPNGTVSGAPKVRAMQIIHDIEPVRREFYAGSLALFDFFGNLKSTILIRSIHVNGGTASTQASAGVVYDSIPEQEWLETRNKSAACVIAMQNTR